MALLSFTKVAREAGAISFWLVYSSNNTVCEALALSEGDIHFNETSHIPSSQHNRGLSENPETIDWLPAGEF